MARTYRYNIGCFVLIFLLYPSLLPTYAAVEERNRYPHDALRCYATLSPNDQIICPEGRHRFCVKEVVNASGRKDCGNTQEYPNDVWDRKQAGCLYRKCTSSCQNSTSIYVGNNGEFIERISYCCDSNLCNSASQYGITYVIIIICFLSIVIS